MSTPCTLHPAPCTPWRFEKLTLLAGVDMPGSENGVDCSQSDYERALDALSTLETRRVRADESNNGDGFDVMYEYLEILELDGPISELKIIHVGGTKGKGSTCAFTESILRNCGFRTGLFTGQLLDYCERFRLDGVEISKEKFVYYFWWCWNRLKERTGSRLRMPYSFRFHTLLAFKILTSEKVDVAVVEVGLGGKYDATNVVEQPIVCGITSLGHDHMDVLGHTLGEIADHKAGIFKHGIPAFTVSQREDAMSVLKDKASELRVPLQVAPPLDPSLLNGLKLGLDGDHQYVNAGLAIALCRTWLQRTGHLENAHINQTSLPVEFCRGLATVKLQGRAQIIVDPYISMEGGNNVGGLVFFLDGAHTSESMEVCAKWFSQAVKKDLWRYTISNNHLYDDEKRKLLQQKFSDGLNIELPNEKGSIQILLFNCMTQRDPMLLLPPLLNTCSNNGICFHKAVFAPYIPELYKLGSQYFPTDESQVELSWQRTIQQTWEKIVQKGERMEDTETYAKVGENSTVFQSLLLALKWLRDTANKNQSTRFQVLVTGSLYLVGDMLKIMNK